VQRTQKLLERSSSPPALARNFNRELHNSWNLAEVGFAVGLNGTIYSPASRQGTVANTFRSENDRFLSNRENVPVFAQNSQQTFSRDLSRQPTAVVNPQAQMAQVERQVVPKKSFAPRKALYPTPCRQNRTFARSSAQTPAERWPAFLRTSCT
jgi:hypothetical protein